jgi:hypothetical protein
MVNISGVPAAESVLPNSVRQARLAYGIITPEPRTSIGYGAVLMAVSRMQFGIRVQVHMILRQIEVDCERVRELLALRTNPLSQAYKVAIDQL